MKQIKCLCPECEWKDLCGKTKEKVEIHYLRTFKMKKKIKIIKEILEIGRSKLSKNNGLKIENEKIHIQSIEEIIDNTESENKICLKKVKNKLNKEEMLCLIASINLIEQGALDEVGYYSILDEIGIDLFLGKLIPVTPEKTIRVVAYAQIKSSAEHINGHKHKYPNISTMVINHGSLIKEVEDKISLFFKDAFKETEHINYIQQQFNCLAN